MLYRELYDLYHIAVEDVIQANSTAGRLSETRQIWQICQRLQPRLLVYTTFVLEGWSIAEKLNIPSIVVSLFPLHLYPIPSTFENQIKNEFAALYANELKDIWYPHIQHWMWRLFLEDQGDFREFVLDLDPIPCGTALRIPPFIYAIDPDLLSLSSSYDAHICGFWTLVDTELPLITTAAKPVLLINFGSMDTLSNKLLEPHTFLLQINAKLTEILDVFDQLDVIWIISDQDAPLYRQAVETLTRIRIMTAIEHERIIRQYPVIGMIHHGGIGTCSTMVQLGVAQAILPFMFDQGYWADRLNCLGLSKTLNLNDSWVNVVSWMLQDNKHRDRWQKKIINNAMKGMDDAIQILLLSYQSQM